jgi:Acetokinase family
MDASQVCMSCGSGHAQSSMLLLVGWTHVSRPAALLAQAFGIVLDNAKNDAAIGGKAAEIQADNSRIKILVLPTDEELSIAQQVSDSHAARRSCCCWLQRKSKCVIHSPADAGGCQRTPGGGIEQQCMQQLCHLLKRFRRPVLLNAKL